MKSCSASFALVVTVWASGSTAAAQVAGPPSPQAAPPVAAPAPVRRDSQVATPTGASRPGATAADLGPINATGNTAAYVSAESTGHPLVVMGSDLSPYGIVGTFSNHPLGFRTNNIARLFIDTSGNVGIGTPGPGYKLDVSGDANVTGTYRVNGVPISATANWTQAGNNIYYTTGNVGIGTTSPQSKFHVVLGPSDASPPRLESSGTNTFAAGWDFYHGATGTGFVGVPDPSAAFGAGELLLYGAPGTKTSLWAGGTRSVTLATNGDVGIGTASPGLGFKLHVVASGDNFGVVSESTGGVGVIGSSTSRAGVSGASTSDIGVSGESGSGTGVRAASNSGNIVEGYSSINRKFHITNAGTYVAGSDFAEALPARGDRAGYEPGDVLVASTDAPGQVEKASRPYDPRVAGIYSTRPGMLGADKDGASRVDPDEVPVAIVGIVPTKVSATSGPIQVGDLLTTSSTPGHAMRCANRTKCVGAVVGKAMEPLTGGTGVIKVLVMLR